MQGDPPSAASLATIGMQAADACSGIENGSDGLRFVAEQARAAFLWQPTRISVRPFKDCEEVIRKMAAKKKAAKKKGTKKKAAKKKK
jgi:hypothetical protein